MGTGDQGLGTRDGRVVDGDKKEAAGGGGGSGGGAGARGEDRGNGFRGEMGATDVDHGADQIADHVMQEAVAANAVDEEIGRTGGVFFPLRREDGADCILVSWRGGGPVGQIGIGGGEAQEIVLAEEETSSGVEQAGIERPGAAINIASQKGRTVGTAKEAIASGWCISSNRRLSPHYHPNRVGEYEISTPGHESSVTETWSDGEIFMR